MSPETDMVLLQPLFRNKENYRDDKKQKQIVKKAEERLPLALRTDGIAREEERKKIQDPRKHRKKGNINAEEKESGADLEKFIL